MLPFPTFAQNRLGQLNAVVVTLLLGGQAWSAPPQSPNALPPLVQEYKDRAMRSAQRRADNLRAIEPILRNNGFNKPATAYIEPKRGGQRDNSLWHDWNGYVDLSYGRMGIDESTPAGRARIQALARDLSAAGFRGDDENMSVVPCLGKYVTRYRGGGGDGGICEPLNGATASHLHIGKHPYKNKAQIDADKARWTRARAAARKFLQDQASAGAKNALNRQKATNNPGTRDAELAAVRKAEFAKRPANGKKWRCNAFNSIHNDPNECADPDKGGVWLDDNGDPAGKTPIRKLK